MSTNPNVTRLNLSPMLGRRQGSPLRTVPNLLTLLRVVLAPFLVAAVLDRRFEVAFALFVMAACTDAMDGLLARWLRQRTTLGQYLDPVADKLLIGSLFLALTGVGALDPRIALVVFGRDFGMLLTACLLWGTVRLRNFQPSLIGKANSFSQVVAIGLVLLGSVSHDHWVLASEAVALDATVVLTVVSGFHYAWVASQRIGQVTGEQTASIQSPDLFPR
jgi:cardiolipin synthase